IQRNDPLRPKPVTLEPKLADSRFALPREANPQMSPPPGARTRLTSHNRNMPHRDKPDPMTYAHSSPPPSFTLV
ncbi:unnamed protein product, partial [Brassica rapa subsp. trilocularis]